MRVIVLTLVLTACGSDNAGGTGLGDGRFGDTCQVAEDCVGLRYDQLTHDYPDLRASVECNAAAGPKLCRFSCEEKGGGEACATLGGVCSSGVCLP